MGMKETNIELQLLLIKYGVAVVEAELVAFRAIAIMDAANEARIDSLAEPFNAPSTGPYNSQHPSIDIPPYGQPVRYEYSTNPITTSSSAEE